MTEVKKKLFSLVIFSSESDDDQLNSAKTAKQSHKSKIKPVGKKAAKNKSALKESSKPIAPININKQNKTKTKKPSLNKFYQSVNFDSDSADSDKELSQQVSSLSLSNTSDSFQSCVGNSKTSNCSVNESQKSSDFDRLSLDSNGMSIIPESQDILNASSTSKIQESDGSFEKCGDVKSKNVDCIPESQSIAQTSSTSSQSADTSVGSNKQTSVKAKPGKKIKGKKSLSRSSRLVEAVEFSSSDDENSTTSSATSQDMSKGVKNCSSTPASVRCASMDMLDLSRRLSRILSSSTKKPAKSIKRKSDVAKSDISATSIDDSAEKVFKKPPIKFEKPSAEFLANRLESILSGRKKSKPKKKSVKSTSGERSNDTNTVVKSEQSISQKGITEGDSSMSSTASKSFEESHVSADLQLSENSGKSSSGQKSCLKSEESENSQNSSYDVTSKSLQVSLGSASSPSLSQEISDISVDDKNLQCSFKSSSPSSPGENSDKKNIDVTEKIESQELSNTSCSKDVSHADSSVATNERNCSESRVDTSGSEESYDVTSKSLQVSLGSASSSPSLSQEISDISVDDKNLQCSFKSSSPSSSGENSDHQRNIDVTEKIELQELSNPSCSKAVSPQVSHADSSVVSNERNSSESRIDTSGSDSPSLHNISLQVSMQSSNDSESDARPDSESSSKVEQTPPYQNKINLTNTKPVSPSVDTVETSFADYAVMKDTKSEARKPSSSKVKGPSDLSEKLTNLTSSEDEMDEKFVTPESSRYDISQDDAADQNQTENINIDGLDDCEPSELDKGQLRDSSGESSDDEHQEELEDDLGPIAFENEGGNRPKKKKVPTATLR